MMKIMEAVRSRRSVRTFDGKGLSTDTAGAILDFAEKAENPYDIHVTWKLLDAKKYSLSSPVIVGADMYIAGKMLRVPHAEEAFGYTFEKVVLYAESLGVGTTWIAGTMNRNEFERAMGVSGDEVMPCVSPLGYPARKMSLRESMMRKGIGADDRLGSGELFFDGSFDSPLDTEKAGKLADAFEAVRLAPSAVNKQPWRVVLCGDKAHFYEKRSKGYVSENGWDLQKIDIGIALSHFEMAAKESSYSVSFSVEDPQISVPDDTEYIATLTVG